MVKVLEMDYDERRLLDEEDHNRLEEQGGSPIGACKFPRVHQSLLALYLDDIHKERKQPLRETLRSLMAFTDADSSADTPHFKEIFSNETTIGPRKNKRKRAQTVAVDLENDQFGDYFDRDDDFSSDDQDEMDVDLPTSSTAKQPRRGGRQSKQAPKKEIAPYRLSSRVCRGNAVPRQGGDCRKKSDVS